MPKQEMIRKKTVARQNTEQQAVGVGVHQSLDVQAERVDLSGIQKGLKVFGSFYEKKEQEAAKKKLELDELSRQQGILAASSGNVDLEEYEQNTAFARGVDIRNAKKLALEQVEERKAELEEWRIENPNGDINEFNRQSPTPQPEFTDDVETLTEYNKYYTAGMDILARQDAQYQAQKDEEELFNAAKADFDSIVSGSNLTGATPSIQDIKDYHKRNLDTGLDSDESVGVLVESALHQASKGNHRYAELALEFFGKNKNNLGKYGRDLQDAIDANKDRLKAEELKQQEATASEKFNLFTAFSDAAEQGVYDPVEVNRALDSNMITKAEAKQFRKSAIEARKLKIVEAQDNLRNSAIAKEPLGYFLQTPENQKKFDKYLEKKTQPLLDGFVNIAHGLREATTPEDRKGWELQVHDLLTDQAAHLRTLEDTGNTPPALQSYFNSLTIDSENFEAGAVIYKHMAQRKLGAPLRGVSEETLANLHAYNDLVDRGRYTPAQAKEILAESSGQSIEEAKRGVLRDLGKADFTEMLEDGLSDYLGSGVELGGVNNPWYKADKTSEVDIHMTPFIKDMLVTKAAVAYRASGDSKSAMKFAIKHIYDNFQPANGSLIPKIKQIPKEFPEAFNKMQGKLAEDVLSGKIIYDGEADLSKGFLLLPTEDTWVNGRMQLRLADDPGTPLTFIDEYLDSEDNYKQVFEETILTLDPVSIVSRYQAKAKIIRDKEERANALKIEKEAKVRGETRRRVKRAQAHELKYLSDKVE